LEDVLSRNGFVEASVMREGDTRIRVEVPGVHDAEEIMRVIGEPADIEFRRVSDGHTFITGDHINSVGIFQDPQSFEYGIRLHFTSTGGRLFREAVQHEGLHGHISILANGREISRPQIQSTDIGMDNTAVITSSEFRTRAAAGNLRTQIESGLFAVTLTVNELSDIPPTLGEGALLAGIIAFLVGLIFIFIFMYLVYGHLGLLSNLSMLIFTLLFLFFLAIVGMVQLTLPGVAGIILAMAMAVDANIIIFERIKDEYKSGKRTAVAVQSGFKKSFWTIFDANVTTIIAALVLFFLGTGPIQGFAITLLLGVIISMFCSLFVLRQLAKLYLVLNPHNAKKFRFKDSEVSLTSEAPVLSKKERKLNI